MSRSVQKGVGLFAAYAVSGAAFGLLFAVVFWTLRRSRPDPFRRALVAGAVLAGALTVAPWLKYPPNPPAVGDPDTLAKRQLLYVTVIVLAASWGLAAAALSTGLRRRRVVGGPADRGRGGAWWSCPLGLAFAVLPGAPDPITVPAKLLWSVPAGLAQRQPPAVGRDHPRLRAAGVRAGRGRARRRTCQYSIPLSAPMPAS